MRNQLNAHYVENIKADSSKAAEDRLIRTSKTLRNKKTPAVTVTDSLPYVLIMINIEKRRGKAGGGGLREDFHATWHCVNAHFTT